MKYNIFIPEMYIQIGNDHRIIHCPFLCADADDCLDHLADGELYSTSGQLYSRADLFLVEKTSQKDRYMLDDMQDVMLRKIGGFECELKVGVVGEAELSGDDVKLLLEDEYQFIRMLTN